MSFEKVLIANRGEIAVRIIRACQALGIATVTVYSEADRGALHVRVADEAICIGPPSPLESYLSAERVVAAALTVGAQAIHPGYGFLSERPHFARAVADAGLIFIGPPADVIALMGQKAAAKRLAQAAAVPTVPGYEGDDQRPERLRSEAEHIGFPLLIKASAGGGGRGMRAVHAPAEFDAALAAARREALAAFGDDAVLLERLVPRPRHVEVQVLADHHDHYVHLFERECSIQRRHQKIIEESPSPTLTPALREAMGEAAVRLARAAGYRNAGTVEFLLAPDGGFFFLEMNTRLQVEHPVTELVTGLDLVRLQLAVAAGQPLPFTQADLRQSGHAIEARVCAEDPLTYLPAAGRIALLDLPGGPGVRNDVGVAAGDEVTVHYDPMVAKLIVHGPDRPAALARLRRALDAYSLLGVTTNLPLLRAVAAHPAFAAGDTHTGFLEEHDPAAPLRSPQPVPAPALAAAALLDTLGYDQARRRSRDPWDGGPWRLHQPSLTLRYICENASHTVVLAPAGAGWSIDIGGDVLTAHVLDRTADSLSLALAAPGEQERTEHIRYAAADGALLVAWAGVPYRLAHPAPPSFGAHHRAAGGHAGLEAPMPGTVTRVLAAEGQAVAAHQPLVIIEAMKMEHTVAAPHDGVVRRVRFQAGALVEKGAVLVELDQP